ncbi:HAD family hydrolase [Streptomyces sp. NPDC090442]|jgi:HAD superfamily hydrolase (TIGR01509 family)|uniref:HAD family hydrolase n=1 Tax=Streptomyces sp. NPDC090442 TaxID=3365962 RepID=UPI00381B4E20
MTSSIPAVGARTAEAATLQAVFLDLDGTLVDTEGFWWEAEAEVFAGLGHVLDDSHREVVVGGPMSRSAGYLLRATGADIGLAELSTLLNEAFVARISRGVALMPGARRLLSELAAHRVPTALVSASHRSVIEQMLHSLGPENFALTVAGDDLARTKPHPDPYLTAAARLGVDPARCAVVEDTLTGVRAGEAAGCLVVAVPSVTPVPPAPGRRVVRTLEEVDLPFLQALITESQGSVH